MEEDIKILEQSLLTELYGHDTVIVNKKSLETLIKGYRELEKNHINPSKARISYYDTKKGTEVVIEGFIPISKITKKISELVIEEETGYFDNRRIIRILQELMEDK